MNAVYPLAKNAIFWSWQGEAHLRGFPMVFLRLAGCSISCPECDTDYAVDTKMSANAIASAALECTPANSRDRWAWITGGEPLDHDLKPLYAALRAAGFSICVATSGKHRAVVPVDWLSVSYHGGYPLAQRYGNEIKLIVGLNKLDPFAFLEEYPDAETDFFYRYVQPLTVDGKEDPDSLSICKRFLWANPNWALSRQDHVAWGMP